MESLHIIDWVKVHTSAELSYVFLIVLLFILPRLLLRTGLPMALTSFALGIIANFGFHFYDGDNVIPIFSTLGIISLFLFAGLEVDLFTIRKAFKPILGHIGFRAIVVVILAILFANVFSLALVPAAVLALALSTPSTGFILDSIESSNVSEKQKYWIKLKAISAELVALGALLVFSQMDSAGNLVGSILVVCLLVVVLPYLLNKLSQTLENLAPGSEFGFILMLAIISGIITKKLGAYYLVGAFLVGIAAGQYKRQSPSKNTDQILYSLRSFSSFFMPFYFFNSGLQMPKNAFSWESLKIALLFLVISLPFKVGSIVLHRRISQEESWKDSFAIAISLIPNLVFGLVLAEILRNKMGISIEIYGGIIIYTLVTTIVSPFIIKFMPKPKDLNLELFRPEPIDYTRPS